MKNLLLLAFVLMVSCQRNAEKRPSPDLNVSQGDSQTFLALADGKAMFKTLSDQLDITKVERVTGVENVVIYMARFKADPNKIYAVSSKHDEMLYTSKMRDPANGEIAVLKGNEAILISVVSGKTTITGLGKEQWTSRFAMADHGGGVGDFCQREPGEGFSTCFKAEVDEFCDSFISCVAVNTQPHVVLLIAASCSCMIYGPL